MRIGIFGGTFDPIHIGHLLVAESVRDGYPLDRILFLPTGIPPHKEIHDISSAVVRLEMCRAAVADIPGFDVSDLELHANGVSYTLDTVKRLSESDEYKQDELFLIIGMDSLLELHMWKDPETLLDRINVLVVGRPEYDSKGVDSRFIEHVTFVETPLVSVSSTDIRNRVRANRSIRFRVPESVETVIRERGLYR